jgi:chromosome segregation ATPase
VKPDVKSDTTSQHLQIQSLMSRLNFAQLEKTSMTKQNRDLAELVSSNQTAMQILEEQNRSLTGQVSSQQAKEATMLAAGRQLAEQNQSLTGQISSQQSKEAQILDNSKKLEEQVSSHQTRGAKMVAAGQQLAEQNRSLTGQVASLQATEAQMLAAGGQLELNLEHAQVKLAHQAQQFQEAHSTIQRLTFEGNNQQQQFHQLLQLKGNEYQNALQAIQHRVGSLQQQSQMTQYQWDLLKQIHQNQQQMKQPMIEHSGKVPGLLTNKGQVNQDALRSIEAELVEIKRLGPDNLSDHQRDLLVKLFRMQQRFKTPQVTGEKRKMISDEAPKAKKKGRTRSTALVES